MVVHIRVHLESTDSRNWVWWADSPDVAGFSATDDSLQTLIVMSEFAIREILGEHRRDVEFNYQVIEPSSHGPDVDVEMTGHLVA